MMEVMRRKVLPLAAWLLAAAAPACAEGSGDDGADPDTPLPPRLDAGGGGTPVPGSDAGADGGPADSGGGDADAGDACAAALAAVAFDFEAGPQGWTHAISDGATGSWPFDPWSHGTATNGSACPSGKCFGAELTQNYAQCQRGHLLSPSVDLSACAGRTVALVFRHAHSFWTGTYGGQTWSDGGVVEVSGDDGATWMLAQGSYPGTVRINPNQGASYACVLSTSFGVHNKSGFVGVQAAPVTTELTLPAAVVTDKVRVRFSFGSGVSSQTTNANTSRAATAFGWRVDDVGFALR